MQDPCCSFELPTSTFQEDVNNIISYSRLHPIFWFYIIYINSKRWIRRKEKFHFFLKEYPNIECCCWSYSHPHGKVEKALHNIHVPFHNTLLCTKGIVEQGRTNGLKYMVVAWCWFILFLLFTICLLIWWRIYKLFPMLFALYVTSNWIWSSVKPLKLHVFTTTKSITWIVPYYLQLMETDIDEDIKKIKTILKSSCVYLVPMFYMKKDGTRIQVSLRSTRYGYNGTIFVQYRPQEWPNRSTTYS